MKYALTTLLLLIATISVSSHLHGQAKWRMPLTVTDSSVTGTLNSAIGWFGVHPNATNCIDADTMKGFNDHWSELFVFGQPYTPDCIEYDAPPLGLSTECRIKSVSPPACIDIYEENIQKFTSFTQVDTFQILAQGTSSDSLDPLIYSVPSVINEYCDSLILTGKVTDQDQFGNLIQVTIRVDLAKTGGRYTAVPTAAFDLLKTPKLFLYHPKVGPGAPAPVTQLTPTDGKDSVDLVSTLTWGAVNPADSYRIQLSDDAGFGNIIMDRTTTSTSTTTPSLHGFTTYWWRVSVTSKYGLSYYQSSPFSFTTMVVTPPPPTQLLPTSNQQNVSLTPTFKWNKAVSALPVLLYQFQLASDANFTAILKDTTFNDTTKTTGILQNCLTYYWRVRASNSAGFGQYSAARTFRTVLATPLTPAQSSPANGATGVPVSPTLSWTSSDVCSDNYRVYIVKDTLAGTVYSRISTNQKSVTAGPLGQDSDYYWRVNSFNALDSSGFTGWRSFHTALAPAAVPTLVTPLANDTTIQSTSVFRWRTVAYATLYTLQVASDSAFTNLIVNNATLTDTSFQVSGLFNCTNYYYRVSAQNASGSAGFTARRKFRTHTAVPDACILQSPPDNKDSVDDRPTLMWAGGACSGSFYVHVSRFSDFSDTVFQATTGLLTVRVGPIPLLGNTDYYWRVRSSNGVGTGPFASAHFKTTPFVRPDQPPLVFPPDGANDIPVSVTLVWDSVSRAETYRVQVALDTGFTILKVNDSTIAQQEGVEPSRTVNNLINSTAYYWRVNAKNSAGIGLFSAAHKFTTLFPPEAAVLIDPPDGAVDVSITTTFDWSLPSRATTFQLTVARDSLFTDIFFNDSTIGVTSWNLPRPLKDITSYYWRVRGKNSVGWGSYSPRYRFTTQRTGTANWLVPLKVAETGPAYDIVYFGVNPNATAGIDQSLGEYELPPADPGWFDARFVSPAVGQGLRIDYQKFATYGQKDTFEVTFQPGIGAFPMKLSWPWSFVKSICDSMIITDQLSGGTFRVHMEKDSALSVASSSISSLYIVEYGAFPVPTDVKPSPPEIPKGFVLYQNYPNPFNPSTHLSFSVDRVVHVRLTVYDLLGREVQTIANGVFYPGLFTFTWEGRNEQGGGVPSGVYYARMVTETSADRLVTTRKMMLVK